MFFSAAKKAAEFTGLVEAPVELVEPEPEAPVITKQPDLVTTLTQVGNVRYTVFNPADDLKILEELFGVLHERKMHTLMECPECCHEGSCLEGTFEQYDLITCSECGHEDAFNHFEGYDFQMWTHSRTCTPEEVLHVSSFHDEKLLAEYYAELSGKEGLLAGNPDMEFTGDYRDGLPIYQSINHSWHRECPQWNSLRGNLKSISTMDVPSDDDSEAF